MLISKFNKENVEVNVNEFVNIIGHELPEAYKIFLIKYNGGETPDTKWNGKGRTDVRGFFGYKICEDHWDFDKNLEEDFFQEILEQGMLAIAENSLGDYICIKLADGTIYFKYHDSEKNIMMANDFESFIGKCKSQKIGHVSTIEERKARLIANGHGDKLTDAMLRGWQAEIDKYGSMVQEEVIL
ncbi:SMI1/KNR4 family protein [Butyrivibrio sp. XBB1001]|uniref:SMI1/KNR4 family protein n=1 Tax=Butyrivibrio sp. XBB1001 TaxID=1280682 RepID=UPI00047B0BEC|nr:SMI1/KNR4 family protein [Butyrivibrio sp. XBB1001]